MTTPTMVSDTTVQDVGMKVLIEPRADYVLWYQR